MTERAVAIKLTVRDQEIVLAALRAVGKEGESAAKKIENANGPAKRSTDEYRRSVSDLTREVSAFGGPAAQMAGHADRVIGGFTGGKLALFGFAAALAGTIGLLVSAAKEFAELERRQLRIEAILKATGGTVGLAAKEIYELAAALEKTTLFDEKDVLDAAAALLTFKSVQGEAFERAIKLGADLAEVMGTDVKGAVLALGKALEDPEKGLTALRRAGVTFTETQKEQIKALLLANKELEAHKLILDEVERRMGGSSVRAAEGLSGAWKRLGDSYGDLKEAIGQDVANSAVPQILRAVGDAIDYIRERGEAARGPLGDHITQLKQIASLLEFVAKFSPDKVVRDAAGYVGRGARGVIDEASALPAARSNADHLRRRHEEAEIEARRMEERDQRYRERRGQADKKAGEQAAKERERILKELEKLEDAAAKKAEETKEAQIDREAENELRRYQKLLDEKKITLAEFARADAAIALKAEGEKAEIARRALDKWIDEQAKKHEQAAKEALKPWQKFGDDLSSILADGIENGFTFNSADMRRAVMRFAGGMANQNFFNPLLSGVGLAQPIAGAEDSPLFSLAKSLSSLGGGATVFGQPLFGGGLSGSAGEQELVRNAAIASGQPVPGGTGLIGGALGGAATGFSIGSIAGMIPGLNAENSQIGGAIGGAIGAAVGSIIPGIGTAIGGLIGSVGGSLFGGLFGPKKPSVGPNSGAALSYRLGPDGRNVAYVQGAGADNGGDVAQGRSFGEGVAEAINRFTKETEARLIGIGGLSARIFGDRFELGFGSGVEASGSDAEDVIKKGLFRFIKRGDIFDFGDERAAQAIERSGATNLDDLLADINFAKNLADTLDGLEATEDQLKAVEIAARDFAREQVKAITAFVDKANELGFASEGQQGLAKLVDQLLDFSANPEEVTESAKALAALAANFEVLRENAEKLGLTEARIAQAELEARDELRRGFDEGIAQQILQLVDPVAAALAEFDKAAARRVKEAEELGANLVEVERLNGLERQRVLEQAANASRSSLADFFDEVLFGALGGAAPGVSLEGRRASFEAAAAQALAGDFTAQGKLPELGRAFLEASRNFFASSEGFQADRDRVLDVVGSLLGTSENPIVAAINDNAAEDRRVFLQLLDQVAGLRAITVEQAALIASLDSRLARQAA